MWERMPTPEELVKFEYRIKYLHIPMKYLIHSYIRKLECKSPARADGVIEIESVGLGESLPIGFQILSVDCLPPFFVLRVLIHHPSFEPVKETDSEIPSLTLQWERHVYRLKELIWNGLGYWEDKESES